MPPELEELIGRLRGAADPDVKQWFDNYLKGAIEYLGVKTPEVTRILKAWAKAHDVPSRPVEEQLDLVDQLFARKFAEEKFAGTIYLQTYLKKADPDLLLGLLERAFGRGDFFDLSSTDWLCVRVVDPMILRHGDVVAARIAGWSDADDFWQRRASIVSFRHACADARFRPTIKEVIATLVGEEARFIQTGIGWVIADWSKIEPDEAADIVEQHFDDLSREVIDRHTKYLPDHKAYKARKRGKAATN